MTSLCSTDYWSEAAGRRPAWKVLIWSLLLRRKIWDSIKAAGSILETFKRSRFLASAGQSWLQTCWEVKRRKHGEGGRERTVKRSCSTIGQICWPEWGPEELGGGYGDYLGFLNALSTGRTDRGELSVVEGGCGPWWSAAWFRVWNWGFPQPPYLCPPPPSPPVCMSV